MSALAKHDGNHNGSADKTRPAPAAGEAEHAKQQFRALLEPVVWRARQHGLNRVQIREIILSLL